MIVALPRKKPAKDSIVFVESISDLSASEKSTKLSSEETTKLKPPETPEELVKQVLSLEDDPTLSPWTFRMWFVGIGVSIFASTLSAINRFRPQHIALHIVFVAVISYLLGQTLRAILPSKGRLGKFLNPGPFNKKEHAAICIMTSAAASNPEAMQILAVQKLWYNIKPSAAVGIFLIIATQMVGYGMAGLLRKGLVYPTKMFYPSNLATASLLESLHQDKANSSKRMRVFWISFITLFCWQIFPLYIAPIFAGISIFCLTHQHSMLVSNLFGGSMANEGLGVLSISLDWTSIGSGGNPLYFPFQTLMNSMIGYILSIGMYMGLYYSNHWRAQKFPFLSPQMYSDNSTSQRYITYNQSAILDRNFRVDDKLVTSHGLPNLTSSHAFAMTVRNMGIMASITHMILWHWNDIKCCFAIFNVKLLLKIPKANWKFWNHDPEAMTREEADAICPHYGVMQSYKEVPMSWYGMIWFCAASVGMITAIVAKSTLPWWAFLVALSVSMVCLPFFAALNAMFGFHLMVEPLIQMIGAYMLPGLPIANMYFGMFGFNSLAQAMNMLKDLKLGQYVHIAPRCVFTVQCVGTIIGCLMSYIMMQKITNEKRAILLSIQGTNVWSGQSLQAHNSSAIGWGGLAKYMYSVGAKYEWVSIGFLLGPAVPIPFWLLHKAMPKWKIDYWNTAIIVSAMAMLDHGTHAGLLMHYALGIFSQLFLRKYRTKWFIKYNYILSAGIDGGSAVIGFILVFAVFGAGGKTIPFPPYALNNWQKGNYDFCMKNPGLGGRHHKTVS